MLTPDEKIIFKLCIPYLSKQPIIFDVGAYKGEYTDYVLSQLPEARCYLFEPNNGLAETLAGKYPDVYRIVMSSHIGKQSFFRCMDKADELSSIYKRPVFEQVAYVRERIVSSTVDAFCHETRSIDHIDFLKIDVEGAELDVLKGSEKMLSRKQISFLQVEYGGTYPDAGITFKHVLELVNEYGYSAYELIDNKLTPITAENFVEDYRFANFLITHHDIAATI